MKVFKESCRLFKLFGCITPDYANKWKNRGCRLYSVVYVVFCFFGGWSSYSFLLKYSSISKADAFCALYQLSVFFGPLATFSVAQFMTKNMDNVVADYQNFYDQNNNMDPMNLMQKAEKRGRQVVKTLSVIFGSLAVLINLGTGVGNLLYQICKYGSIIDYAEVHRPYRCILPWDQNTRNGWILETLVSVPVPIFFFSSSSGYASFFLTTCEYHIAFCKIVNYHLTNIDDVVRCGIYRIDDLRKMFHETVSFHLAAKELFLKSDNIYSFFVAPELTHFMLLMTFMIFHIDHAIRHLNLHFLLMVLGMIYGVAILYLYCYYGQKVTDSYAAIADHSYNSDWMNLPMGLRRMNVLLIAHAQKELYFRGAGMVDLKRETFVRLARAIIGYVLMFKTMAE